MSDQIWPNIHQINKNFPQTCSWVAGTFVIQWSWQNITWHLKGFFLPWHNILQEINIFQVDQDLILNTLAETYFLNVTINRVILKFCSLKWKHMTFRQDHQIANVPAAQPRVWGKVLFIWCMFGQIWSDIKLCTWNKPHQAVWANGSRSLG